MKTALIILTTLTTMLLADIDMGWVDKQIEEIKPQRSGLNGGALARLKNPFIVIKEESNASVAKIKNGKNDAIKIEAIQPIKKDMSKEPLTLQMIMNSAALINDKWIKKDEFIRGYKLKEIQNGYVVLKKQKKSLTLFISKKSKNLNITTK